MNRYVITGFLCFFIDRLTKLWAMDFCCLPYVVTSWCYGELALNKGISWSIGASCSPVVLGAIAVFITAGTMLMGIYCMAYHREMAASYAFALIMGGALSNILDRWLYGGVIDFIVLHYHNWYWPTFNVADIAICCGALLWLCQDVRI